MEIVRQYDKERQLRFLTQYLLNNKQIRKSCEAAQVGVAEYYRWKEYDADFRNALLVADEEFTAKLKSVAYAAAMSGADPYFTLQVIEREDPRWDTRLRVALAAKAQTPKWDIPEVIELKDPFAQIDPPAPPPQPATETADDEETPL